ncbi:MAG TPA: TolC family protein [Terriglobales bacterium]|nr:TolC family protein [Terriglobales bacterium]
MTRRLVPFVLSLLLPLGAQKSAAPALSLAQAQATAAANRPKLREQADLAAELAAAPNLLRAGLMPQLSANLTGAGASNPSRIAAGSLNNPVIFSRYANGLNLSETLTDFGRTGTLIRSSRLLAQAGQQDVAAERAQVRLEVDEAYFGTLQAQAVLRVAQQAVAERQLIARQIGLLAQNKLRSDLDVSFAQVNLAQAQLLLSQAQAQVQSSYDDLALAMGTRLDPQPVLQDEVLPAAPNADLAALVAEALRQRPELQSAGLDLSATQAYAQAQRELWRPTLSAAAAAGLTPAGAAPLPDHYAALGLNLNIPVFNGGLFSARRAQATAAASASQNRLEELQHQVTHDVQQAWLRAITAQQNLDLTQKLQQQAALAMRLAQSRYSLGLGTIVELSQAQLNQTQADISEAQARYAYEIASGQLAFELGRM